MERKTAVLLPAAVLLALVLAGCQDMFTTSLFSFMQRDPADLPPAQQVAWAEQALASGDPDAMAKAFAMLEDNPNQTYLAASLAAELSGVPQALAQAVADMSTLLGYTDPLDVEAYFDGYLASVDAGYAADAALRYSVLLLADPEELSDTDMVMGALCLAFVAADASGSFATADYTGLYLYVDSCLAVLEPDNVAADILNQIDLLGT
jgi:hypothetical protein